MKIIQVHNYYQQAGGEDVVVKAELELLRSQGEEVITYYKTNDEIHGVLSKLKTAVQTIWNQKTYKEFKKILKKEKPDIVHCHNTFPLISPSIYWACSKEKVPVVQTMHNYRLLCLNAFLFRNNEICEKCIKRRFKLPGIVYKCYKNSFLGSFIVAEMLLFHTITGTWRNKVDKYIALTEFHKCKLIEGGLPREKIVVKTNFTEKVELGELANSDNKYILFVGRLSKEKGCDIAIKAWHKLQSNNDCKNIKFFIIGDGPEKDNLINMTKDLKLTNSIDFLEQQPKETVLEKMKNAECIIIPSLWYETFGLTIIEAFAQNCPVIASNIGSMASIINSRKTGILFEKGNSDDLSDKLHSLLTDSKRIEEIKLNQTKEFDQKYTSDINYNQLKNIYTSTISKT
ncbi:MAG: glycosyltransferase family 4 protein [Kiritimatiellae bacterium]|jgi:glycosyltransferase involved in cell wall biosynthesis|nr:glycosyltransferase family 4 protein [Kiritimatiellia bacterium]